MVSMRLMAKKPQQNADSGKNMRQVIPKMASARSVGTFTSLPNRPGDVSSVFRSRRTVVQAGMGGSGYFFNATKLRLLHGKTTKAAIDNEFSSRNFTDNSQGVQFGGEEFVSRLLHRRWTLANPDAKINKVILLSTVDTNLQDSPATHSCLALDTNICTYNDLSRTNTSEQSFYIVRDDLLHPLINGNKARKLDGVLPLIEDNLVTDVDQEQCTEIGPFYRLHVGVVKVHMQLLLANVNEPGRNLSMRTDCLLSAVLCAERGLRSHLLLRGEQPEILTGYNLMSAIYGNVTYVPRSIYANREKMLKSQAELVAGSCGSILWFDDIFPSITKQQCSINSVPIDYDFHRRARKHDRKVIVINEGAGDAIALLGLIRLVHYLSQNHLLGKQRTIKLVVDAGTGTTAIGLGLGALCLGLPWEVTAVMLADTIDGYKRQEKRLICEFRKHFGYPVDIDLEKDEVNGGIVNWVERFRPRKFGNVLDGEVETCRQIAQETGILVDPIYTLAAWEMATLLSQEGAKPKADAVVLLHTGGTLGMFGIAQSMYGMSAPLCGKRKGRRVSFPRLIK